MLDALGKKYGTDKSSLHHGYLDIYESYLKEFKNSKVALIELGVGGYQFADRGGEGLRMWHEYFQQGKIIGIDIYPKEGIINDRTEFWQGLQNDYALLKTIIEREESAEIRIVVDDASHNNKLTIETFNIIFPQLKSEDIYFVEDVHSSYWENEEYEGCEVPEYGINTTMDFFQVLTHQLNAEHFDAEYRNEFAGKIAFIHFYKELIVIKKL